MRLIDADALGVGRCSRELLPAEYCAGWNGLVSLIEQAPTIDAVEVVRWIPVEERLPENDRQRVLAVCIGDCPIGYPKMDTDRYVRGHWVRYGNDVTHWMPLPEPPIEEQNREGENDG